MRKATFWLILGMAVTLGTVACTRTPDDQALSTEIKARMFSEPQVKNANLNISVKNGEATLAGEVPSDAARYAAYKIAGETPGVRHVDDRMTVRLAEVVPPPVAAMPAPPEPAPVRRVNRSAVRKTNTAQAAPAPAPPVEPQVVAQAAPGPPAAAPPPPPPQPHPRKISIPSGTRVLVRMIDSIDSQTAQTGQMFRASLASPLQVEDELVAPQGTDVMVRLAEAKSAGRVSGRSELKVELAQMTLQGRTYPLVTSAVDRTGSSRGKDTAVKAGGGAVLGAIIGAIAGGGKGAAIGTIAGAGAGTAVQVLTHGQQIRIPSETTLDFRLEAPLTVTLLPDKHNDRTRAQAHPLETPAQQ